MADTRGKLISVEGIDGVGKTTHAGLLVEFLVAVRKVCFALHFPCYETEIGRLLKKALRKDIGLPAHSLFALFSVNRLEKKEQIEHYLESGCIVVSDRYTESEFAYGLANGLPFQWLLSLESQMPAADLVVLLDVDARKAMRRLRMRADRDSFEQDMQLQCKVRSNYLRMSASPPYSGQQWVVVDSAADIARVQATICRHVTSLILEPFGGFLQPFSKNDTVRDAQDGT